MNLLRFYMNIHILRRKIAQVEAENYIQDFDFTCESQKYGHVFNNMNNDDILLLGNSF